MEPQPTPNANVSNERGAHGRRIEDVLAVEGRARAWFERRGRVVLLCVQDQKGGLQIPLYAGAAYKLLKLGLAATRDAAVGA